VALWHGHKWLREPGASLVVLWSSADAAPLRLRQQRLARGQRVPAALTQYRNSSPIAGYVDLTDLTDLTERCPQSRSRQNCAR
jgi:hypothetical protein